MKIILVGGGKVRRLCRSLVLSVMVLIRQDEAVSQPLDQNVTMCGILGNGANFKVLEQANIESCDILSL